MYRKQKMQPTVIGQNKSYIGETIEEKVRRVTTTKEPIKDGAPLIYTDRKDGVLPGYDIRTDRMEIAVEAMDTSRKAQLAKREGTLGQMAKDGMDKEAKSETKKDGGPEPTNTTDIK